MIRRRLTSTKGSEGDSTQPRRRRISRSPSPSIPRDDRDPQLAELRANFGPRGHGFGTPFAEKSVAMSCRLCISRSEI